MRFVACLFGIVFTLISLLEFLGGDFWLYRGMNVLAAVAWWVACRKTHKRIVVPEEEELIELREVEEQPLPAV
jgi:hypothetical protein